MRQLRFLSPQLTWSIHPSCMVRCVLWDLHRKPPSNQACQTSSHPALLTLSLLREIHHQYTGQAGVLAPNVSNSYLQETSTGNQAALIWLWKGVKLLNTSSYLEGRAKICGEGKVVAAPMHMVVSTVIVGHELSLAVVEIAMITFARQFLFTCRCRRDPTCQHPRGQPTLSKWVAAVTSHCRSGLIVAHK